MEKCSYFIKDTALFGSFPSQADVDELEKNGVIYFIDLTHETEDKILPYTTKYNYLKYSITDRKIPTNRQSFAHFIIQISNIINSLKNNDKIYIHCKGGHGRSGVVVACLLCYIFNMTTQDALKHTERSHSKRRVMREKWRTLGSPQTISQKTFVSKFFEPLYFYKAYLSGNTAGLSNFSLHPVSIPNFGNFPTAEAAFQAYKCPNDKEYVKSQENAISPIVSKHLGRICKLREDWYEVRVNILYNILEKKFEQHDDIREKLLNTGFRPIIEFNKNNQIHSDKYKNHNTTGILITKLRNKFLLQE
jgi:ribA/ribD-fused uncharacterized protein